MSKDETKNEPAFKLHYFKNNEDVKFIAENARLKNNRLTLNKKATDEFFAKEGYTTEMREIAAKAERRLFEAGARATTELLRVKLDEAKKAGEPKDVVEKTQTFFNVTDPNYKLEVRNTAHQTSRNPADEGAVIHNYGALRFKHQLKNAVDPKVYEETQAEVKKALQAIK